MLAETPAADAGDSHEGHDDQRDFRQDVIAESMQQPVLVDFWAPWCGPCKQLTPVIEKAVKAAGGKVKLVKMNIDEHPQIAGQLGIQSIPAVFAFQRGPARRRLHGRAAGKPGQGLHRAARRAARAERGRGPPGRGRRARRAGRRGRRGGALRGGPDRRIRRMSRRLPPSRSSMSISAISRARSASSPWCREAKAERSGGCRRARRDRACRAGRLARRPWRLRSAASRPIPSTIRRASTLPSPSTPAASAKKPSTNSLKSCAGTAVGTRTARASSSCSSSRPGVRPTNATVAGRRRALLDPVRVTPPMRGSAAWG